MAPHFRSPFPFISFRAAPSAFMNRNLPSVDGGSDSRPILPIQFSAYSANKLSSRPSCCSHCARKSTGGRQHAPRLAIDSLCSAARVLRSDPRIRTRPKIVMLTTPPYLKQKFPAVFLTSLFFRLSKKFAEAIQSLLPDCATLVNPSFCHRQPCRAETAGAHPPHLFCMH